MGHEGITFFAIAFAMPLMLMVKDLIFKIVCDQHTHGLAAQLNVTQK